MQSVFKTIRRLPRSPGVYLFKDRRGEVVYVGKAANLRERVRSYFKILSPQFVIPAEAGIQRLRGSRIKSGMTAEDRRQSFGRPIEDMIGEVARIEVRPTPTVIEALILEATLIKKHWPRYNVREKDQKSFLYVVITKEKYPRVELVRGEELSMSLRGSEATAAIPMTSRDRHTRKGLVRDDKLISVFGPFPHASAIRAALRIIRKIFPYSTCRPPLVVPPLSKGGKAGGRPCFNYHLGLCPGVCVGAITPREYKKIIRNVMLFFEGKKTQIIRELKRDMTRFSKEERFEDAARVRNQIRALEHIRDVAVLTADRIPLAAYRRSHSAYRAHDHSINILGRLEGYDISNIGGKFAVGSMVVFENGEPKKSEYRLFKIKTVKGANDVAMMKEVLRRRLKRISNIQYPISKTWPRPSLILVDGGMPQVNAAREVLRQFSPPAGGGDERGGGRIPIIGIAKGPDRKRDEFVVTGDIAVKEGLDRITRLYPHILKHVRDEAHRFAQSYYRRRHRQVIRGQSRTRRRSPLSF